MSARRLVDGRRALTISGGTMSFVRFREGLPWLVTVLLAVGVLALVTTWVLDAGINRGEALKTGGLAAGSVVALYALWLNDRRRRTEEERQKIELQRHELELKRQDHDRERVADERFARAVELLGNEADQVRVGALHALAGLARSRPAYTQTVLDVLCSYLRRPFDHYRYAEIREDKWTGDHQEADRELQVRSAVQRLITDLLPPVSDPDAPAYDLDLHAATLEFFSIRGKAVGQIRARETNLYGSNWIAEAQVRGRVWFTSARCWGRLWADHSVFHDKFLFGKVTAHGEVIFDGTEFRDNVLLAGSAFTGSASFGGAAFAGNVDFTDSRFLGNLDLRVAGGVIARTHAMKVSLEHEVNLPDGWVLDRTRGTTFGLVRA